MLVAAVLAGVGWLAWSAWHSSGEHPPAIARTCVTPSSAPSPIAPADITVAVLNTTPRVGLAHHVASDLASRGFHVGHVGNTTPEIASNAIVSYGEGQMGAALSVAEQVPNATLQPGPKPGVTLLLGKLFTSLASADAAATARTHDALAASPRPPICGSP